MTLWVVRGGKQGQYEQLLLDENMISFGWDDLSDLSTIQTKEQLLEIYLEFFHTEKKMRAANQTSQIWSFYKKIQIGDLVVLPLKSQSSIVIGEIIGDYTYNPDCIMKHRRDVKWLKTVPRSEFDQDVLYALGAFLTIYKVRDDAEKRVRILLENESQLSPKELEDEEISHDYIQIIKDQIIKYLEINFSGHELANLINEILLAKGFTTKVSPPGPDGGVDILAGSGSLGFDSPRICVQVKSSHNPGDVRIVRELDGVVKHFKADYGLLVAWGGLNNKALREINASFFSTKLWDQGKIVDEIMKNYDKFSDEMKIKLPLKQIWSLVEDTDD